jgi:hypothetical protein
VWSFGEGPGRIVVATGAFGQARAVSNPSYGQYPGTPDVPPAPPRKRRTGLIIGLVTGVAVLLLGVGGFLVVPKLLGDDKSPAGATAAARRGLELMASHDYGGYYDMLDNGFKAKVSRADFIRIAECMSLGAMAPDPDKTLIGDATVEGDTAKVKTRNRAAGSGESFDDVAYDIVTLVWQDNHWRYKVGESLAANMQQSQPIGCRPSR